jgi:hypothetical protein
MSTKPKIALMTYAFDNRQAKGTALYAKKLTELLVKENRFDFYTAMEKFLAQHLK